jgi:hypothetical protein
MNETNAHGPQGQQSDSSLLAQLLDSRIFSHFNCFSIIPGYANGDDDEIASNLPQRSINELQ